MPTSRPGRAPSGLAGSLLALLIVSLFAANAFLHYPGTMSNDSINQYREAISGRYTDWHPPVMAWLWSMLLPLGEGPAPFLLLHLALHWLGFGLLAGGLLRDGHPRLALLLALAGAFPPFLYLNGTVGKDVGMVSAWVAAVGTLFWFRVRQRSIPLACGIVVAALMAYGTLVRANALFALGPLLLYALAPAGWLRSSRLIPAAIVIAVLSLPITQEANRRLFNATPVYPVHALFLYDLMGMAVHEGDSGLVEPRATIPASELRACYSPYWWDSLSPWGRCAALVHRPSSDFATLGDGLPAQWFRTILAHPSAYVTHRLKHFNSSVLFAVPAKHIRLTPEYRTDDPAIPPLEVVTERDIRLDLLRKNPFTWPVTWLAWGAALLVFLARAQARPTVQLARVLVVSALGYSLAYLVAGVATDMRYHYWTLMAVLVATLLTLPQLGGGLRSRSRPLLGGLGGVALVVAVGVATRLLDYRGLV